MVATVSNPPKAKGTNGENEVKALFADWTVEVDRTHPGVNYDLRRPGYEPPYQLLFTRPDRGRWLVTLDAAVFAQMVSVIDGLVGEDKRIEAEVKRYRRFSLHTIFESKFK
jgi:hypothetical protein